MIKKILKAQRALKALMFPKIKEETIKPKVINTETSNDEVIET